jgi:hypothetical protein
MLFEHITIITIITGITDITVIDTIIAGITERNFLGLKAFQNSVYIPPSAQDCLGVFFQAKLILIKVPIDALWFQITRVSLLRRTTMRKVVLIGATFIGAVVLAASPVSLKWSEIPWSAISGIVLSIDQAQARIGQPGTAASVAGVNRRHRRHERREYRRGY